jgi:hypothetical protein
VIVLITGELAVLALALPFCGLIVVIVRLGDIPAVGVINGAEELKLVGVMADADEPGLDVDPCEDDDSRSSTASAMPVMVLAMLSNARVIST